MKTYLNFGLVFCILFSGLMGCKKKEAAPTEALAFSFQLLNEQGQETSVFAPNQNIIFHFEARNTTDSTMYFLTRLWDIDTLKLPAVYRGSPAQSQLVGKPYRGLCRDYVGGPHPIAAHNAIQFTIKWLNLPLSPPSFADSPFCTHAVTTQLPRGHYYASFTPSFVWYQTGVTTTETTSPPLIQEFDVQ